MALPFAASADFAIDKAAGVPCPNLGDGHRCTIHDRLLANGFAGCVAYDCFGAGQRVSQVTFRGQDWRITPAVADSMFAAYRVAQPLHELLWYLREAAQRSTAAALHPEVAEATAHVERLAALDAAALAAVDVARVRRELGPLLRRVSALVRAERDGAPDLAEADLLGADLRARDLRAADLRGACLVGADARGVEFGPACLLGTDLRGADLRGAGLADVVFLTSPQVGAARGDARTRLPAALPRPAHW